LKDIQGDDLAAHLTIIDPEGNILLLELFDALFCLAADLGFCRLPIAGLKQPMQASPSS